MLNQRTDPQGKKEDLTSGRRALLRVLEACRESLLKATAALRAAVSISPSISPLIRLPEELSDEELLRAVEEEKEDRLPEAAEQVIAALERKEPSMLRVMKQLAECMRFEDACLRSHYLCEEERNARPDRVC